MPAVTDGAKSKSTVSPPMVAAACIALLAVIIYLAVSSFSPVHETLKIPKSETTRWIEQKAAESSGEYSRLSPQDQQKLQKLSHGRGETMLKMLAPKTH